jgi:ABC-type oligopeptide transport system ATPase subunit
MAAIEVSKLKRTYKASLGVLNRKIKIVNAVDGISFEVQKG